MVKRILIVLDDKKYEEYKKIKNRANLKWEDVLLKGIEAIKKEKGMSKNE
ncbi:MAG: hypothetical protein QXR88_01715 [Candidatus Pacearchaeota archaeon]